MLLPFACWYFVTILVAALQPMSYAFQFKVYILRHGQTDANAGGIIQGSADFSRLTELGKQQAEDAYRAFDDDIRISSIHSAPLSRARETLEELRQTDPQQPEQRLPPTDLILDNLREIDFFLGRKRQSGASSSISRILASMGSWESQQINGF
jgi:hypothetical protein